MNKVEPTFKDADKHLLLILSPALVYCSTVVLASDDLKYMGNLRLPTGRYSLTLMPLVVLCTCGSTTNNSISKKATLVSLQAPR